MYINVVWSFNSFKIYSIHTKIDGVEIHVHTVKGINFRVSGIILFVGRHILFDRRRAVIVFFVVNILVAE